MNTEPDNYLPTRESLLIRLRNWDDQTSWNDFFDTYGKLIYSVARRAGLSDAEAQDVVQETVITVARKLPGFQYDPAIGSFKAWLLTLTRSRIQDQFRKKSYHRGGQRLPREEALNTSLLDAQVAPDTLNLDAVWAEEWRQNIMDKATERVKSRVSPRQYQMFYLHGLKGIPARQVAERLSANLNEVYDAKRKIAEMLRNEVEALESSMP